MRIASAESIESIVRTGNLIVLAAVLLPGASAFASESSPGAATPPAAHPLETKTLVVIVRDGTRGPAQPTIDRFDKNFGLYAIDAGKMAQQFREALQLGLKEDCEAFWVVATGRAASRVLNDYKNVVEILSSGGAGNYKVVLLNPDEEAVEAKSPGSLEDKNLCIVDYDKDGRSPYREAVSRAKAHHTDGILSWIETQGIGEAPAAWEELTDRDMFKLARVATRTLGPKSLPAKKETPAPRGPAPQEPPPLVPDVYEKSVAKLIVKHPQQKRAEMVHCPYLNLVARAKALDIVRRKYPGHIDPDGYGPNHVLQSLGYELPKNYGRAKNANTVESIVGQWSTTSGEPLGRSEEDAGLFAGEAVRNWMTSPPHRKHLLGHDDHSRRQTRYGFGFAHTDYRAKSGRLMRAKMVVFIAAPPSLAELPPLTEKVVYEYLARTPAQRERRSKARPTR